jgi:archaeal flagellar protein FlaJ
MYKYFLRTFGRLGISHFSYFLSPLKEEIKKSNLNILFEIYIGRMILFSVLGALATFFSVTILTFTLGFPPLIAILSGLITGATAGAVILTFFHSYPYHILTSKKNSIESNMPFAINHMAAIASSGVPPVVIFKLLSNVKEYGEITEESKRITRNIEVFGMDVNSALKNVGNRTPSPEFRQFLYGIISTIETGGDLKKFFESAAKESLFEYRLKREKYLQTLSTYADFYTAVLIAAPLFFISILSVMALIGGQILGLSIPVAIQLGIYILIPMLNIAFLAFVHYTQPQI